MSMEIAVQGFLSYLPEEGNSWFKVFALQDTIESIDDLNNVLKIQKWVEWVRDSGQSVTSMSGFFRTFDGTTFGTVSLEPSGHLEFIGNLENTVVSISHNPNEGSVIWRTIGNDLTLFRRVGKTFEPVEIVVEDSNE